MVRCLIFFSFMFSIQAFALDYLNLKGPEAVKLIHTLPEALFDPESYWFLDAYRVDCRQKSGNYTCTMMNQYHVPLEGDENVVGPAAQSLFEALPNELITVRPNEIIKYAAKLSCYMPSSSHPEEEARCAFTYLRQLSKP